MLLKTYHVLFHPVPHITIFSLIYFDLEISINACGVNSKLNICMYKNLPYCKFKFLLPYFRFKLKI